MTATPYQPEQPFFAFRLRPIHLSIGRGGRYVYISTSACGRAYTTTWQRQIIFAWGGKWRFRVISETEYPTASAALGYREKRLAVV